MSDAVPASAPRAPLAPLAIVTGGCHRLGAAIAAGLARAGWDLALHAREHCAPEAALADTLAATGRRTTTHIADFADPEAAGALPAQVAEAWGRAPDLLVNSAAAFGGDRLADARASDLLDHYAVNAASPARATAGFAALASDAAPGARAIVNILDQRIVQPHGDQFAYTLSKMALAGLTEIAARELAPRIRVNAVAPGLVLPTTDYDGAMLDRLAAAMPLARLPEPAEIAAAVVFLAGARAVTAQTLFVDAGARLKFWDRDFMHVAD